MSTVAFLTTNPHGETFRKYKDWDDLNTKEKLGDVRQAGLDVLRALKWALVSAMVTVWTFGFWAADNTDGGKQHFGLAVWAWLLPYL